MRKWKWGWCDISIEFDKYRRSKSKQQSDDKSISLVYITMTMIMMRMTTMKTLMNGKSVTCASASSTSACRSLPSFLIILQSQVSSSGRTRKEGISSTDQERLYSMDTGQIEIVASVSVMLRGFPFQVDLTSGLLFRVSLLLRGCRARGRLCLTSGHLSATCAGQDSPASLF